MNNLNKMRRELYIKTMKQKSVAWDAKTYDNITKIRKDEQKNYEKWKLLDGIIKAKQKEKQNGKNEQK